MKKNFFYNLTIVLLLILPIQSFAGFKDVGNGTSYITAIEWMQKNKVINGYPDGTFRPEKCVNRAELLKVLIEVTGKNVIYEQRDINLFSDVKTTEWYFPYVNTARSWSIVNGYPDGTFRPEKCVNRVEAIKMAVRGFDLNLPENNGLWNLADVDNEAWYSEFFTPVYFANLLGRDHVQVHRNNIEAINYFPAESMTRAEVSEMLYRMKAVLDNNLTEYTPGLLPQAIIAEASKDISFDGCGTINSYSNKIWYQDFVSLYEKHNSFSVAGPSVLAEINESCLALDNSIFIAVISASNFVKLVQFNIPNKDLREASYQNLSVANNSTVKAVSFGKRVGQIIPLEVTLADNSVLKGLYNYIGNSFRITDKCELAHCTTYNTY